MDKGELSQCRYFADMGERSQFFGDFRDFVQTSFMDGPLLKTNRPYLILKMKGNQKSFGSDFDNFLLRLFLVKL